MFSFKEKKILEQHLEHTPWWRSKVTFDFLYMKARDKLNRRQDLFCRHLKFSTIDPCALFLEFLSWQSSPES